MTAIPALAQDLSADAPVETAPIAVLALATPTDGSISDGSTSAPEPPRRPLVQIGFDTVAGAPRYADRTTDEHGMTVVRFSSSRQRASAEAGMMPSGLPVSSARLTSRYGWRVHPISGLGSSHRGVDLAVATGTPVVATSDGEVVVAGWSGGYGILVAIDHGGEVQTLYGHLSSLAVQPGQRVVRGQMIGRSGSTGRSTGPHVHYEVRVDGHSVDPLPGS